MWTQFFDMHSGGGRKLEWDNIFIEASKEAAIMIFTNLFDHDPYNVTCDCCGDDYSIIEYDTLTEATSYERARKLAGQDRISLPEYIKSGRAHFVFKKDLKKEGTND